MINIRNSTVFLFFLINSIISYANVVTSSLPATANVSANCSLNSVLLNFGNYDPIGANASAAKNGTTSFQISCTKGANAVITLNNGLNSANARGTTRAMTDGSGHYLSYELYSDSGYSAIWNNSNPVTYVPTSYVVTSKTIYGKIPGGQNSTSGNYMDTVTITATF